MVRGVSGNDVGQGTNRESVAAGDAGSHPGIGGQIGVERNRCESHAPELLDVGGPGDAVRFCPSCGNVLIEALQGRLESAGEPEGAKRHGTLGVGNVVQQLANAPFLWSIAMHRPLFRYGRKQREGVVKLADECGLRVVSLYLVDVRKEVRSGF